MQERNMASCQIEASKMEGSKRATFQMMFTGHCIAVLRIIKLKQFPVPVRWHSGSGKFEFRRYLT